MTTAAESPERAGGAALPAFSVVVPTLNEVENIDALLEQIFALDDGLGPFEVVVVDDASTDGTDARVRAWAETRPVRLIERRGARGLAGAVIAGARAARADVVVVMDADLSHPVRVIPALVRPVLDGRAGVAIGSRRVPGGATRGWPLRRHLASHFASALAWPISSARDPMSGFFATRRSELLALGDAPQGFKILLELLASGGSRLRPTEVPIEFVDRARGSSKLGLGTAREYLLRLAALAGCEVGSQRVRRLRAMTGASALADALVFALLAGVGAGLAAAQLAGAAVAFAGTVTLCARDLFAAPDPGSSRISPWARLAGLALLAAFLRGGVLASLVRAGLPPIAAFLPALACGVALLWLGAGYVVFTPAKPAGERELALRVGCLAVAAYLFALRAAYLGALELLPEEAYYWSYSQHLALSYLDHPPLVAWLIAGSTALLGQNEWAVRLPAFVCSLVTAGFAAALAGRWLGKTAAAATLALCAALPFFFASGALMTPDAPLAAAWSGALYFLWRALVDEEPRAWPGAGVCMGLGLLAKYTIALLGLGSLAFVLLDARARAQLRRPQPWLAAGLALLLFSPVIAWNRQHQWASFAFQSTRRLSAAFEFGLHHLVAGVAVLLGPPVALALAALASGRARRPIDPDARRFRFAACAALAPLAVVVLFSLAHPPKLNWTGPFWLALLAPAAALLARPPAAQTSRLGRAAARSFAPSLAVALVAYGAMLHSLALGVPGAEFPNGTRYAQRWRAIAAIVDREADALGARDGAPPLVIAFDRYATPSLLAFYQPKDDGPMWEVGGRSVFGLGTSLMYDRWYPPESVGGRTLLCVSEDPGDLELAARFAREPGPVQAVEITAGRKGGERLYLRALYGYDPAAVSGTKRKKAAASSTALSGASSSHIEPSSRMPSAARASSPSSSGLAGFAFASDSSSLGTHSGR